MSGTKLPSGEIEDRIKKCFNLRYQGNVKQVDWIKYCHEHYGDKSEQQYHQYWSKAKERYTEDWKEKLNKLLDPAINELYSLISSDDEKIKQRAVDQIIKYTGNEVTKIEGEFKIESINLSWGDENNE